MSAPAPAFPQTFPNPDGSAVTVGTTGVTYQMTYQPAPPVPCPPCPPAPPATVFGVDTDQDPNPTILAAHTKLYSKMGSTKLFKSHGAGFWDLSANNPYFKVMPASCVPIMCVWDVDQGGFETMLGGVSRPVRVCLGQEADRHNGGALGLAGYQTGWKLLRSVRDQLPDAQRKLVTLTSVHTGYWMRQPGNSYQPWFVEGAAEELFGDVYQDGWLTRYQSAATLMDPVIQAAGEQGVPWGLSEYGSIRLPGDSDGSGRVGWMTQGAGYAVRNHALVANWWCAKPSPDKPTYVYHLDGTNSAPELSAWQGFVGSNP